MKAGSQHLFVDESGRPEVFNRKGSNLVTAGLTSNHLVIACVRAFNHGALAQAVANAAPKINGKPRVLHAVSDAPTVRQRVLAALVSSDIKVTAIVMDKRTLDPTGPWIRDPARFYNDLLGYLLGDLLQTHATTEIVLSRKDYDAQAELQAMILAIQKRHRVILGRMASFQPHTASVQHRPHSSSRGLQAADYAAYAVFQAFERGDITYVKTLEPVIGRIWDLAEVRSYTRKQPMQNPP